MSETVNFNDYRSFRWTFETTTHQTIAVLASILEWSQDLAKSTFGIKEDHLPQKTCFSRLSSSCLRETFSCPYKPFLPWMTELTGHEISASELKCIL